MEIHKNKCEICNKQFYSYKTLWTHTKKFHANENQYKTNKLYKCLYCVNSYKHKQSKCKHQKKCKEEHLIKENIINQIRLEELKLSQIKEENKKYEIEVKKIYAEIKLSKLNNINITTNNNHNSGTINNVYVKYNDVLYDTLSNKERNEIFNSYNMIEESIKKIHFNPNIPEQQNVYITNLKDLYCNVFDGKQISTLLKHELLPDLVDLHLFELCMSKDKYKLKNIIADKIDQLENQLNREHIKYSDINDKVYKNYKEYIVEMVKILIYNLSDKNKVESLKKINNFICKELETSYN